MPDLGRCPACGKGSRAVLYCRRPECGLTTRSSLAAVDLPRPKVEVTTTSDGKEHVVISRDGRGKSYEVEGATVNEKIRKTVEKVINDRFTGEWLP